MARDPQKGLGVPRDRRRRMDSGAQDGNRGRARSCPCGANAQPMWLAPRKGLQMDQVTGHPTSRRQ